jgi:hypothetical protein
MSRGGNPWRARVWREAGSSGTYAEMDPDVRPPDPAPREPQTIESIWSRAPYPEGGSVATVLAWVGADRGRAAEALAAEEQRGIVRSSITSALRRMLGA